MRTHIARDTLTMSAWLLTNGCGGGRAQQQGALVPGNMQQPSSAHFAMPMMGPGALAALPLAPSLVRPRCLLEGFCCSSGALGSLSRMG